MSRLQHLTLPFALVDHAPAPRPAAPAAVLAPPPDAAVLATLARLQEVMLATHAQVELLRQDNAVILQLLSPGVAETTPVAPRPRPAAPERQPLRFYLLGSLEVRRGETALTSWTSRKARQLLAYLAMDPRRLVPKEALIEVFWPECSPARGANNLSIAVYQVRLWLKDLAPADHHGVRVQQGLYGLDPGDRCWVDVEEFRHFLQRAHAALQRGDHEAARAGTAAAVELYRGDFLESDPYEEWTVEPRRSLAAALGRALAWLATDAAQSGDWPAVVHYAGRAAERDCCDEEAHRLLMTAHWQLGNRAQALLQYRLCEERLREELAVAPSEATRRLYLTIRG